MSRIRTIKPEMWTSDDFLHLDPHGRLLFIYLFSNADDEGRLKTSPKHLLITGMAGSDVSTETIETLIKDMQARGMVQFYCVKDATYVQITNWERHQKVAHPRPSTLPAPPNLNTKRRTKIHADSGKGVKLHEDSAPHARPRTDLTDLNPLPPPGDARRLWDTYVEVWSVSPVAVFDPERQRVAKKMLERYGLAALEKAVRGSRLDPWEGRIREHSFAQLLRPDNIEKFIRYAEHGTGQKPTLTPAEMNEHRRALVRAESA